MLKKTNHIKFVLTIIFFLVSISFENLCAQVMPPADPAEPPPMVEQQLENLTQASDDATTEDDSYLQELVQYIKDPVNLNYADEGQLQELKMLSPIQISNLILYRKLLGNFISIYELQAVPDWDINLIKSLRQ